jgi:hypothetical protein
LSHTSSPFCSNYFGTEILKAIFPVSASQVARITGIGHQHWLMGFDAFLLHQVWDGCKWFVLQTRTLWKCLSSLHGMGVCQ